MVILEEEQAIVAALNRIKDYSDVKLILKAIRFDRKDASDLRNAREQLNKQVKRVSIAYRHLTGESRAGRISIPPSILNAVGKLKSDLRIAHTTIWRIEKYIE